MVLVVGLISCGWTVIYNLLKEALLFSYVVSIRSKLDSTKVDAAYEVTL